VVGRDPHRRRRQLGNGVAAELVDPSARRANACVPTEGSPPVAHLGRMLGLVVVRRVPGSVDFTEEDERLLVGARPPVGLALHNVRLDSALQASSPSSETAQHRTAGVRGCASSRRRTRPARHRAQPARRRSISSRSVAAWPRQIAEDGDSVLGLLDDLRGDVQTTIAELRELAHGIYPAAAQPRLAGRAHGRGPLTLGVLPSTSTCWSATRRRPRPRRTSAA